jgi:hypothetical protein
LGVPEDSKFPFWECEFHPHTEPKVGLRHVRYSYHIYGDIGHKIINCHEYSDMQNMFNNKRVKTREKPFVVEPKVTNPSSHIVDVNMVITKRKVIEEQVFKNKGYLDTFKILMNKIESYCLTCCNHIKIRSENVVVSIFWELSE